MCVVRQKSHCEEIFGTGQGNPNLHWDCKQGFLFCFLKIVIPEIWQIIPKKSQNLHKKKQKFPLFFFWLEKRQKFVGNEALIVSTDLLRNVENLSCVPHAR
jgi:hypothetical protein